MQHRNENLRTYMVIAIFTAISAVFAQITIPLPIVPITGQTLAVGLVATVLGSRYGTISMILYAVLGAIGVPVFAGFSGGPQVLIGPTGGFIFGFIATAFIMGYLLEKTKYTFTMALLANLLGMVVTFLFGVTQLKLVLNLSWANAMAAGVTPFIAGGVIKAVLAAYVGIILRKRLISIGMLKDKSSANRLVTN
ncbi:biotin transporter BioY [Brevibacillus laterosporus]|uniref:Biotin transporter n=1 Tax=Brevibacillus laterosporus TaxID=1465 RepID=A0AAP8U703_BRELA|nr:biotin transporter BioY [Brevibacillus laterosporus]MCR8937102.1 biotin transporter BioY [Brevibacillus laterosporus]MCR8979686.1 biotin transporter BioY [Brevibacillus laterosporus]MCZ0806841.1 biotin transporter BioY [Brevibacillus laterosporus]MCZ0825635.1 biotin transporter BioY [Brevibacillus laterosporus]MCZ0839740.1 biotin transporter BioY [Brevibacillus laterosporus]